MKKNRFKEVYCDKRMSSGGGVNTHQDIIFKDKITGVLYLQTTNSRGNSVIPLIDADGKPLVDK